MKLGFIQHSFTKFWLFFEVEPSMRFKSSATLGTMFRNGLKNVFLIIGFVALLSSRTTLAPRMLSH